MLLMGAIIHEMLPWPLDAIHPGDALVKTVLIDRYPRLVVPFEIAAKNYFSLECRFCPLSFDIRLEVHR